jgi:hypothetical protein
MPGVKWMLFVQGPPDVRPALRRSRRPSDTCMGQEPDISHFVKRVCVVLHPTFAPDDAAELTAAPFHLIRRCARLAARVSAWPV